MRLTASQMPRATQCQYWMRDNVLLEPDRPTIYARLGTAFHDAAEIVLNGGEPRLDHIAALRTLPPAMLARLERLYDRWRPWWADAHSHRSWLPEYKLALDCDGNARRLPPGDHRDYKCEPGEVPGTADAVCLDGELTVIDWKTGSGLVSPVYEHAQLRFLGAALAEIQNASSVRIAIARVGDFGVFYDHHLMTAKEIAETIEDVAAIVRMSKDAEPNPGPWCKSTYCKAVGCVGRERAA